MVKSHKTKHREEIDRLPEKKKLTLTIGKLIQNVENKTEARTNRLETDRKDTRNI